MQKVFPNKNKSKCKNNFPKIILLIFFMINYVNMNKIWFDPEINYSS